MKSEECKASLMKDVKGWKLYGQEANVAMTVWLPVVFCPTCT